MFKKTLTKGTPSKTSPLTLFFMKSNEVKHHQIHHCMALKSSIFDKNEPLSYHFTQKFSFFELVWTIFQRKYFIYEIFTQRADFILSEPVFYWRAPAHTGAQKTRRYFLYTSQIIPVIYIEKNQSIKGSDQFYSDTSKTNILVKQQVKINIQFRDHFLVFSASQSW